MLATFFVNSMTDDGVGTTFREAVDFAIDSLDAEDIIKFDPTVFANGGAIRSYGADLSIENSTITGGSVENLQRIAA